MNSMADILKKAGLVTEDEAVVAKRLRDDLKLIEDKLEVYKKRPPCNSKELDELEALQAQYAVLNKVRVRE